MTSSKLPPHLPRLSQARAPVTASIVTRNEAGVIGSSQIPAERALTIYLDKRELVTLMTLGAQPEWLVLGYLCNQRLIASAAEIASISVDWEVAAAAVSTHHGITDIEQRTAQRVVTTGCGQGSVFAGLLEQLDTLQLPDFCLEQRQLLALLGLMRLQQSIYKSAGSVHGCALFGLADAATAALPASADAVSAAGVTLLCFVEDVGRHNAIDAIAGWMALQPSGADDSRRRVFYTTGRLTSEMILKAAQMGVPIVVSRSGITQMAYELAQRLGLCAIGRASNRRFLCYSAPQRLRWQPELATASAAPP